MSARVNCGCSWQIPGGIVASTWVHSRYRCISTGQTQSCPSSAVESVPPTWHHAAARTAGCPWAGYNQLVGQVQPTSCLLPTPALDYGAGKQLKLLSTAFPCTETRKMHTLIPCHLTCFWTSWCVAPVKKKKISLSVSLTDITVADAFLSISWPV